MARGRGGEERTSPLPSPTRAAWLHAVRAAAAGGPAARVMRAARAAPPSAPAPRAPLARPGRQRLLGALLVLGASAWLAATWFALFGAKLLAAPAPAALAARGAAGALARALAFLREDWHYASLAPLSIAAWLVFVYCNWLAFKYFKHN